jgi:hypothetical protein
MNREGLSVSAHGRILIASVLVLFSVSVRASTGERGLPQHARRTVAERGRRVLAGVDCTGLPDGTPCDDGNACTSGETCRSEACVFPIALSEAAGSPVGVGTGPVSVAVGDFNLDGRSDMATANFGAGSVTIALGDGSGGFAEAAGSPVAVRGFPIALVRGDFNHDDKLDLAEASQGTDSVTILLGDGAGGFAPGSPVSVGSFPLSVAIGDFNLDGKADLAVACNGSASVTILLGNGSGGFDESAASPVAAGVGPTSVATGDLNFDGNPDLAVANFYDGTVTILLGDGVGGFAASPGSPAVVGDGPIAVAIGDFDLDGNDDLAAANILSENVTILVGDGAGGLTEAPGSPVPVATSPSAVAVGDLDLDGTPDLIVTSSNDPASGSVTMLVGNGSGRFAEPAGSPFVMLNAPSSVAVVELNFDGKPDLVVPSNVADNVTVLLNGSGVVACPASDTCAVGICVPATGACATAPAPVGAACSDGNPCTTNDGCHAGVCGGSAVTCTVDPCHSAGSCDPGAGCPSVPDGTACSDRNACTQADSCQHGTCTGSEPVVCPTPDQCHVLGTCDPASGACSNPNGPDDRVCDDANPCTMADVCRSGVCVTPVALTEIAGPAAGATNYGYSVAVSDFNLDGFADLAFASYDGDAGYRGKVTILLGNGSGGFAAPAGPPTVIPGGPYFVAAGDFDLDGKPDLVVAVPVANEVTILLGDGTGLFTEASGSPLPVPSEPLFAAIGDLNLDGRPDLVVTSVRDTGALTILLGNGSGGFTEAPGSLPSLGAVPGRVVISDFNLDEKPDLAVVVYDGRNSVAILLGDGSGGFAEAAGSPFGVTPHPGSITDGDFNLDGKPDLAITHADTFYGDSSVTILLGDGSGGFAEAVGSPISVGTYPTAVVDGDFDLDGKPDLAVATSGTTDGPAHSATILLGNGSGGFTQAPGSPVRMIGEPVSFAVGDFDRDGRPDLAAAGFFNGHTGATLSNAWNVAVCPGTDACNVGICDPATGACAAALSPATTTCSDANTCTTNDGCHEGVCGGATVTCTAIDSCHVSGSCEPATGCSNPNAPDGTACSDTNACTRTDSCQDGSCTGSDPVTCPPLDRCHQAGTCDPDTGACSTPIEPDGTSCSDGDACTENDACSAGSCVSGSPSSCDDGDACTVDSCDPTSGCQHAPDPSCKLPPDCGAARPSADVLWPPDHRMVRVGIVGVVDSDGAPVSVRVTRIAQDEAVEAGRGATCPDGGGIGTGQAILRAERDAQGDGRVYTISFVAGDAGSECTGTLTVCVPHDQGHRACGSGAPTSNSEGPCDASAR